MMNKEEINKTIAKFMGDTRSYVTVIKYTDSIDSLVPVWEKLQGANMWISFSPSSKPFVELTIYNMTPKHKQDPKLWGDEHIEFTGKTLAEAAAKATVEAIERLNK